MRAAPALAALAAAATLATAGPAARPAAAQAGASRIVVSTDGGVDDRWALAHLALEPRVALVGVVTTHAPALAYPAPKTAARLAKEALTAAGRADVPVVPGLVEPFGGEQDIKPGPAVDLILDASRGHTRERPLRVLALGAATDVALALVVDPSAAERLEVIAVGFDAWPRGGDAGNVKHDPLAWKILLQSRVPIVVADAVLAKRDLTLTRERARGLAAGRGQLGAYLARAAAGQPDAWPVRDAAPAAWMLGHASADAVERPALADDLTLRTPTTPTGRTIRWLTRVDAAAHWAALEAALDRRAAAER